MSLISHFRKPRTEEGDSTFVAGAGKNSRSLAFDFVVIALVAGLVSGCGHVQIPADLAPVPDEGLVFEGLFGPLEVEQRGSVRTLLFVNDDGTHEVHSQMDVLHPDQLRLAYTRAMFAGFVATPDADRVVVIGLGGGSMVRFAHIHKPDLHIDAVEIDAVVVDIADRYFGTRPSANVRILTQDGFDFFGNTTERWDIIFMDAFIQPGETTDAAGVPQSLRTERFLRSLHDRLTPDGVVVFNLIDESSLEGHVALIELCFGDTWRFDIPDSGNVVVVATPTRLPTAEKSAIDAVERTFDGQLGLARFFP